MQIVFLGDNFHGMSKPISGKKNIYIINLSSAEFAQKVVKVKYLMMCLKSTDLDQTAS